MPVTILLSSLVLNVIFYRLSGFTYLDVLHIYGISRAGYVPQLFSIRLPNPMVIYELLRKANAAALIHDSSFESILDDCLIRRYCALKSTVVEDVPETLPSIWDFQEDEIAFIFHTSGSTSGSPKLVPTSYRWLNSAVVKSRHISRPENPKRQDVTVWM
jgi:acyl-CoA synthetase (AMP-forming)/AMP-acid ligase II